MTTSELQIVYIEAQKYISFLARELTRAVDERDSARAELAAALAELASLRSSKPDSDGIPTALADEVVTVRITVIPVDDIVSGVIEHAA